MRAARPLRGALVLAIATAALLSACVPMPPAIAPPTPPVAVPPPVTPSTPPVTPPSPSASPTPTPTPTQAAPLPTGADYVGPLWGGTSGTSASGAAVDTPGTATIPATQGSPLGQVGSAWGTDPNGNPFMSDQSASSGNLLLTTTGRLFMSYPDGKTMTCTATVINSATDNIAITAAHCLYDPITGQMASEIEFVPGYDNGSGPFGTWTANYWWMPQYFIDTATASDSSSNGNGWAIDFGYVRFDPSSNGTEIEELTGGQGVSFRGETNGALSLGYPSNAPYDGSTLRFCSTDQVGFGEGYWPHFTMGCVMTGGMSGGPWLTNVDPATGAGTIVAVNSTIPTGLATGAPLGSLAFSLLQELETS